VWYKFLLPSIGPAWQLTAAARCTLFNLNLNLNLYHKPNITDTTVRFIISP
jgi:hypothetical protein